MNDSPTSPRPACRRLLLVGGLLIGSLALTGCANDRHTGAVIGGVVGATIGYVIATESDYHDRHDYERHPQQSGHGDYRHHPPPPRDPYCR